MRMLHTALVPAAALLVVALVAGPASAETVQRSVSQLANGLCGANNPVNDQYLRRLTSGLRNSGSANVSVVCSQWGDDLNPTAVSAVSAHFRNDKVVAYNVTCTLAMGTPYWGQVTTTKTVTVPAGGVASIQWSTLDFGTGVHMQWVNLQCSVPQAFTMREIGFAYSQNVGA